MADYGYSYSDRGKSLSKHAIPAYKDHVSSFLVIIEKSGFYFFSNFKM